MRSNHDEPLGDGQPRLRLNLIPRLIAAFDGRTYSGRDFSLQALSWHDSCSLREKIRRAVAQSPAFLGGHPFQRIAFELLV